MALLRTPQGPQGSLGTVLSKREGVAGVFRGLREVVGLVCPLRFTLPFLTFLFVFWLRWIGKVPWTSYFVPFSQTSDEASGIFHLRSSHYFSDLISELHLSPCPAPLPPPSGTQTPGSFLLRAFAPAAPSGHPPPPPPCDFPWASSLLFPLGLYTAFSAGPSRWPPQRRWPSPHCVFYAPSPHLFST